MQVGKFVSREKARRDTYRLLLECYYLPEEKIIKKLTNLENLKVKLCPEALAPVLKMREEIEKMDNIESLKVDYSKLFVGPYQLLAPPYGSVYLEGKRKIMGNSTLDARTKYREAGLDISEDFKEPPDHIATELEFMYYLISKEIESIGNSNLGSALAYLKTQKEFLENHLGVWVSEFADNIEDNAETEFYKHLARFTKNFVKKDLSHILEVSINELSSVSDNNFSDVLPYNDS